MDGRLWTMTNWNYGGTLPFTLFSDWNESQEIKGQHKIVKSQSIVVRFE
jgi:hypothetical protein